MYSATHVVGGQSIPKFDYDLAKGVAKTFKKRYTDNLIRGIVFKTNIDKEEISSVVKMIHDDIEKTLGLVPSLSDYDVFQTAEIQRLGLRGFKWEEPGKVGYHMFEMAELKDIQSRAYQLSVDETDRATYQAMEALIHNLNTMNSRAGCQTPFSSINYGTDTSPEGRMVIKNVLLAQEAGLGHSETPIFPIHIFKVKEGVNFNPGDPNYDMFKLACRVSAKRLFPNFEFIDSPFNLQYYKEGNPDTEVATMGAAVGKETVTIKIDSKIYRDIPISYAYEIIYTKCKSYWLGRHDASLDIIPGVIGIYKITHVPSGLFYIGGSKDIRRRWIEHRYSIRHKGNLGDSYNIGDNDHNNYTFELLETCHIDLLWERESYWYKKLNNENCINYKDPINNGNFIKGAANSIKAMKGQSYSDYENKGRTKCTRCDMLNIYVLSHGVWSPIRNIIYNDKSVPLNLLCIHFDGRSIEVTEDHPLHTDRGRIETRDLRIGDKLIDTRNFDVRYEITNIEHIDRQETYDFETDNDMFDLSGILSHNCRTRVIGNVHDPSREVVTGRGNLSFTSINLPRLAIEAKGNIDKFFELLDKMMYLVIEQLKHRFKIQCNKHVYNFPFLMGQGVWMDSEKLSDEDDLSEVLKHGSLSVGFIGLSECLIVLIGKHHGESEEAQELGLKIIGHMRDITDKEAEKTKLNFTLLATPAESLSGRFVRIDKKKYGVIPGVTDKDYYTNSFHVTPSYDISAFDKIRIEAPYHALTNAGHISYVEMDGDPTENLAAFEKVVKYMKYCGIGYGAINHPIDTDPVCGYTGIIRDECPHCGRKESDGGIGFERLRRITGYLTTTLDKWNDAKRAEEKDRVKHNT